MKQIKSIECGDSLPNCETVLKLLEEYDELILTYSSIEPNYIDTLIDLLSEYSVFHFSWNKTIAISLSISTKKIIESKNEIYLCAKNFRQDASELMKKLAVTFDINLETLEGLHELKFKKSIKQRGKLDDDWKYYLHGAECQFENINTGQIVEVIIIEKPEFGYLDTYFFYNYMATTERFKKLASWFDNDYLKVGKAIDILSREGILTRNVNVNSERNILAL